MQILLKTLDREIFLVTPAPNCCYLINDKVAGGILINTPIFSMGLLDQLLTITPINYIFFPSYHGAHDPQLWQQQTHAKLLAHQLEINSIDYPIDIIIDNKVKLTRTIDFLPMSGVTRGSCALRLKNKPSMLFFGPILQTGEDGWPTLLSSDSDFSYENRVIGALALQDIRYEYAFTDDYQDGITEIGPGADQAILKSITNILDL